YICDECIDLCVEIIADEIGNDLDEDAAAVARSIHENLDNLRARKIDGRLASGAMTDRQRADATVYKVVVNHEEQYSVWPADRENATGWRDAGKTGTRDECTEYIREVWTDMRPLSLRKQMAEEGERE
ncbi:MAG TPA: MbtH family NRPS accessory protein, partial [Acidimicrobiales bacterium]